MKTFVMIVCFVIECSSAKNNMKTFTELERERERKKSTMYSVDCFFMAISKFGSRYTNKQVTKKNTLIPFIKEIVWSHLKYVELLVESCFHIGFYSVFLYSLP